MRTACCLSLTIAAVALSSAPAKAQSGYVVTFGGSSFEQGVGASLDAAGNGYYTGTFRGTVDFDPDTSTVELTAAGGDVYVVSYNGDGRLRFAFSIGNAFGTDEYVGDIAARSDGSFVVTGTQPFGTIDYDPDPIAIEERAGIIYVAGYDSSGSFEFAVAAPGLGTANTGAGESVAFDPSGNVYVAGSFVGTVDLAGIGSSGPGVISSVSSTDGFVASYEPNGVFRNALRIASEGAVAALGVAADARGNVFVTGRFAGTASFDPDDRDANGDLARRTSAGATDAFLASYDSTGVLRFAHAIGSAADDSGEGVDVDDAGFVYVAGIVADDVDFDPSVNEVIRTGHPNGSAFLACYANNGDLQFAFALEGSRSVASDVATTAEGKSVIAGFISGEVDLDPDTSSVLVDAAGGTDVFAARYSPFGKYILGYTLPGSGLNRASAVDLNAEEGHVITGSFSGVLDVDPGPGVDERAGAGQTDAFIARFPAALIVANDPEGWTDIDVRSTTKIRLSAPYPNPASDEVHLALRAGSTQQVEVSLHDLVGRRVAAAKRLTIAAGVSQEFVISTQDLTAGVYFIVAKGDKIRDVQRVVVLKR